MNRDFPHCHFLLNEDTRLKSLPSNYFGFIYTSLVLQHIAEPCSHEYIVELVRVLKPGGTLIFQVPERLRVNSITKVRARLALRSRLQSLLGRQRALRHGDALHQGICYPEIDDPKRRSGGGRGIYKFLRSFFFRRSPISDARTTTGIREQAIFRGQTLTGAYCECA